MKTEKKKTLRGSALFTVVAVMAILILFLTGTLMLATASNRRAHKSYSVSQASYTARSAIRSFKAALEDPTNGPGIQAALYSLDPNDPTDILEPQILMGDNSMGRIGYWDNSGNWKDNCIKIEAVPGRVDWVYNETSDEWIPYNVVLVTSTCRLGREEETVHAFISRNTEPETHDEPVSDSEVKGLQEAGGNTFENGGDIYGGLGVGLADDPSDGLGAYELNNEFKTHTTLNFINASVYNLTSSFEILVEGNKTNTVPVSGTVIMGNCSIKNNAFITLKKSYEMTKNYRQKDIPYLFVDQLIYEKQGTNAPYVKAEDDTKFQPFNIYAGTMYYPKQFMAKADLYLMDEPVIDGAGKYELYEAPDAGLAKDKEYWPEYIEYSFPSEYMKGSTPAVPKGENYFGCDINGNTATEDNSGSRHLYKWTSSMSVSRKDSYDAFGGNIFCKGDFHMGGIVVDGDLRVDGDLYIEKVTNAYKPVISGNLVVKGNIINHSSEITNIDSIVGGIIYNDGLASGGGTATVTLKPGYEKIENALYPGYTEIETAELDNRELKEENGEIIITDDGIQCVIDGNTYSTTPYILTVPITDTTYGDSNPAVITTEPKTRYEVDKDGKFVFTGEGEEMVPVQTTSEKLYYDDEGNRCSEIDAKGTYYIKSGIPDVIVPFSEANSVSSGSSKSVPYSEFVRVYNSEAYPVNMTREKIYGEYQDGKFITHPETKLVTTLDEARKALSWNKTDGAFDKSAYPYDDITFDEAHADHLISGSLSDDLTITRPADSYEYYVLEDVDMNGHNIYIEDAPGSVPTGNKKYGGGIIRFLIKGNLKMGGNSRICLKNMPDTIYYNDDYGIEYYGYAEEDASGAVIGKARITQTNNNLLVGSIKAPYMDFDSNQGLGPDSFTYVPESGDSVADYKPVIIGNALINQIKHYEPGGWMNNFKLAYTKSGTGSSHSSSETDSTETTGDGKYIFTYFTS